MTSLSHPFSRLTVSACLACLLLAGCGKKQPEPLADFQIHPDFQLELVASEPLVLDPIALRFDEAGRAFVLEMPGYPLHDEQSRLILLEDSDSDGIYDRRKVFAENLQQASAFMPYRGGMLVAAPPDLLWVRDTNQDEVADDYQLILSGFSTGNLQHNYNGLTYGLDNWIYAANGGNSGHPYFAADTTIRLDMRDDDFRFRIEDRRLERVGQSSGGYGLAFDEWGRMYETHNLEHVSHLVFENRYIEDLPVTPRHALSMISDHEENGLARIYPIGEQDSRVNHPEQSGYFSGSCGITFYGGDAFPEGFNNQLFVADVVLNLIHMDVLSPAGASLKASRLQDKVEFMASKDRAFRPVSMSLGPDGGLYVVDFHRTVIEHPEWIPDELEVNMDLAAGKEKGRIYRISPKNKTLPAASVLDPADPAALVAALGHGNQWTRMTAQRLLVSSGDAAVAPQLEARYQDTGNAMARLHALRTLEGLGQLKDEMLQQALGYESAGVRENAIKIAERRLGENPALVGKLIDLLTDANARVVMQAALALSTISDPAFQQQAADLLAAFGGLFQNDPTADQWTVLAAAAALKRGAGAFCHDLLEQDAALNEGQQQLALILARELGQENAVAAMADLLQAMNSSQSLAVKDQAAWIAAFAEGWAMNRSKASGAALVKALEGHEKKGDIAVIRAGGNLRKEMGLPPSDAIRGALAQAKQAVLDAQLPAEERLEYLQLIELDDFAGRSEVLYSLLDHRNPVSIQKEALRQLWEANEAGVGPELVARWPELGPEARKSAGDILLYRRTHHDLLLSALEDGRIKVGELNFDLERRRALLRAKDETTQKRAAAIFSDAGVTTRKEAMEKMRPALQLAGDLAHGKEIFRVQCATCHQYGDLGENVGPVLTEISRKSRETLLHDILDPNAAVDTRYLNHRIQTKDGNTILGIVEQETDAALNIRMMGGQTQTIPKNEIESFSSTGLSLMPEGLENGMSEQDMADLLAFLQEGGVEN